MLEPGLSDTINGKQLLSTGTITRDAHAPMTGGDDKFTSGGRTATEPPEVRHNEPHYGYSNVSHRKRSVMIMATTPKTYHHWNFK